jgi:hypothetical protein
MQHSRKADEMRLPTAVKALDDTNGLGPVVFIYCRGNDIWIIDVTSHRSFPSTHVKPYPMQPSVRNDENPQDSVSGTNLYSTDAFDYENSTYDTRISAPYTQDHQRHTALHSMTDGFVSSIFASRIVESNSVESKSAPFEFAKENEIAGLFDRRTFELIKEDEIQTGSNVLGTRFVLCVKQKDGK